jgi:hypothetical protein
MKSDTLNLDYVDKKLSRLCVWLEQETGLEFTETSLYRPDGTGVHSIIPVRGRDLRMRNYNIGIAIVNFINSHWIYDPERPHYKCAIYHDAGSGHHIHLQVHPNTIFRAEARAE